MVFNIISSLVSCITAINGRFYVRWETFISYIFPLLSLMIATALVVVVLYHAEVAIDIYPQVHMHMS